MSIHEKVGGGGGGGGGAKPCVHVHKHKYTRRGVGACFPRKF